LFSINENKNYPLVKSTEKVIVFQKVENFIGYGRSFGDQELTFGLFIATLARLMEKVLT
jgi:hypothetical protein